MPIQPLPQFEEDLAAYLKEKEDRDAYERLNAPTSIVVRFGYMRMVGEFPYTGKEKPGCGSKLVVRTHRGTEIGEMLTSTCPNSGCSKSVTRKEMLEYIENSGGRQYPFHDRGKVLRVATVEDLNEHQRLEQQKNELRMRAKRMIERADLPMQVIEAEPMLGGERVVIYFGAEDRIDFRDLVTQMQDEFGCKVELRQIGARDEARITADYERCGQYCCCKNFLKVLKPISMKSAKIQKATLDPLKISGRCGRLMCCLRYEDETYEELRKNLPHRKSRVGTPDGDGVVISTQILTQLALIKLDDGTEAAYPIEDLGEPGSKTAPVRETRERGGDRSGSRDGSRGSRTRRSPQGDGSTETRDAGTGDSGEGAGTKKKKRRRRKRKGSGTEGGNDTGTQAQAQGEGGSDVPGNRAGGSGPSGDGSGSASGEDRPKKKKRRRRRRKPSGGEGNTDAGGSQGAPPSGDA